MKREKGNERRGNKEGGKERRGNKRKGNGGEKATRVEETMK